MCLIPLPLSCCCCCSSHTPKSLPGKGRSREASDGSSEGSSEEFGEEDDDEEGNYEVEEDEEELEEEESESEGEWGAPASSGDLGLGRWQEGTLAALGCREQRVKVF